jgi:hypothetical protein
VVVALHALVACTPAFRSQEGDVAGASGAERGGRSGAGGGGTGSTSGAAGSARSDGAAAAGAKPSGSGGSDVAGTGGERGGRSSHDASGGQDALGGSAAAAGSRSGNDGAGGAGSNGSGATGGVLATGGALGSAQGGAGSLGGEGGHAGAGAPGGAGSSSAGRAGAAGGPATTTFCTPVLAVDDMEDGDALTCEDQGRSGDWWSATGTPTGSIEPSTHEDFPAYALGSDARAGSRYGMRLSGTGFGHTDDDWASLGFFLAGGSTYDLTTYGGLTFYGKSRAASTKVHVEFATLTTTPSSDGGACDSDCTDHFEQIVTLGADWQKYTVAFDGLAQEGWGVKPKDLAHTIFVYFGYQGSDGGSGDFDFLVDDVSLY